MKHGVHRGLDRKELLGITDVGAKVLGHGRERLEDARKQARIGLDQRVGGVADVEPHLAVVGVDRGLDRIADVVAHVAVRLGVRIHGGSRVGVKHPVERAVLGDDHVGIVVVAQKRSEAAGALEHPPVDQQPALGVNVARKQDVLLAKLQGKQQPPPDVLDGHAARPLVSGVDVLGSGGIVKLFGVSFHEAVVAGKLAIIDLRTGDVNIGGRDGRDILDEEHRKAVGRRFVYRPEAQTVAVRETHVLVDPVAAGQAAGVELPRRERHLPVSSVDPVAVVVHADEVVVGADFLELGEGRPQGLVVPQADVAHGGVILADLLEAQVFAGGELALLEAIERVGLAGELDAAGDKGPLLVNFVGRHDEALHDLRIDRPSEHPDHD